MARARHVCPGEDCARCERLIEQIEWERQYGNDEADQDADWVDYQ